MSQFMPTIANQNESKTVRFLTHYYSKSDVMRIWNITDHAQFCSLIGEEGKALLKWRPGKMRFAPNLVRQLIELVGRPLEEEEIRPLRKKVGTE